jgi:acetyl-CoA carboxylase carboxyltransferase component
MCGKAYGARFIFAWPSAAIAVMGGEQAAQTLVQLQVGKRAVSEQEKQALLADIRARYETTMDPRYAAARLWVDGILDPRDTRDAVAACLEATAHQGRLEPFSWGVLQT